MHRTYGSLFPLIVYIQRIKIRCYNTNRGYASSCNATRAVGSTHFATPGFNPVRHRQRSNKSHRLGPFCIVGFICTEPRFFISYRLYTTD